MTQSNDVVEHGLFDVEPFLCARGYGRLRSVRFSDSFVKLTSGEYFQPLKYLLKPFLDFFQDFIPVGWQTFVDRNHDLASFNVRELFDADTHDVVGAI